jgi:spore coat protein U-like protein
MPVKLRDALRYGLICTSTALSKSVLAATCTLSATALSFGNYSPLSANSSTGTIKTTCLSSTLLTDSYIIALSSGAGSFTSRHFAGSAPYFTYQMYLDPAHTQVWGDGTGTTMTKSDTLVLLPSVQQQHSYTIYGKIPANQYVAPGSYTDTITVTLTY